MPSAIALLPERDAVAVLSSQPPEKLPAEYDELVQVALTPEFTLNVPFTVNFQSISPLLFFAVRDFEPDTVLLARALGDTLS